MQSEVMTNRAHAVTTAAVGRNDRAFPVGCFSLVALERAWSWTSLRGGYFLRLALPGDPGLSCCNESIVTKVYLLLELLPRRWFTHAFVHEALVYLGRSNSVSAERRE